MLAAFMIVLAYLLGSIPFGLLITQIAGLGDIRLMGSGNIGATNVLRTGKKRLAVLTLLMDMLKGTLAVLLTYIYASDYVAYAAIAAIVGHMFPVWLRFKGGKGVATTFGVLIGLSPQVALMAMLVWLASAIILRISSASALISVGTIPIFLNIFGQSAYLWASVIIIILVFFKHAGNIARLMEGTEPHIGEKTKSNEKEEDSRD